MQRMFALEVKFKLFENDFAEKLEQFVKKLGARERMRSRRGENDEEAEGSNTPNVLIPI